MSHHHAAALRCAAAPSRTIRRVGRRLLATGALVVASAGALEAQRTTITFDGLGATDDGSGVTRVANCYREGGLVFRLTGQPCGLPAVDQPASLMTYTPDNGSYTGSAALFNEASLGTQVRLTATGGRRFSLFSLDLAPLFLFPGGSDTQMVTFTGTQVGGMTVTRMFDLALGETALQRVRLEGFRNLTSATLDFGDPDGAAQFDNIGASVVPEPSTYLLMATGLLGLGAVARRRRTQG